MSAAKNQPDNYEAFDFEYDYDKGDPHNTPPYGPSVTIQSAIIGGVDLIEELDPFFIEECEEYILNYIV